MIIDVICDDAGHGSRRGRPYPVQVARFAIGSDVPTDNRQQIVRASTRAPEGAEWAPVDVQGTGVDLWGTRGYTGTPHVADVMLELVCDRCAIKDRRRNVRVRQGFLHTVLWMRAGYDLSSWARSGVGSEDPVTLAELARYLGQVARTTPM